jgi:hypothetical protein
MVGRDQANEEYEAPEIVDLGPIEDVTFGLSGLISDGSEGQPSAPAL